MSPAPMPDHTYEVNEDVVKKVQTPAGKSPRMLRIKVSLHRRSSSRLS